MSVQIYNIVDTGALGSFAQTDTLDSLFAGGRKVVITEQVIFETLNAQPDGTLRPNQIKIQNWLNQNASNIDLIVTDVEVDISAYNGFHPNSQLRGTFVEVGTEHLGEISIGKYLNDNSGQQNSQYRVISHDNSLLNAPGSQNKVPGDYYSQSSTDLMNNLLEKHKIDGDTYRRFFDLSDNTNLLQLSPERGGVNQNTGLIDSVLSDAQINYHDGIFKAANIVKGGASTVVVVATTAALLNVLICDHASAKGISWDEARLDLGLDITQDTLFNFAGDLLEDIAITTALGPFGVAKKLWELYQSGEDIVDLARLAKAAYPENQAILDLNSFIDTVEILHDAALFLTDAAYRAGVIASAGGDITQLQNLVPDIPLHALGQEGAPSNTEFFGREDGYEIYETQVAGGSYRDYFDPNDSVPYKREFYDQSGNRLITEYIRDGDISTINVHGESGNGVVYAAIVDTSGVLTNHFNQTYDGFLPSANDPLMSFWVEDLSTSSYEVDWHTLGVDGGIADSGTIYVPIHHFNIGATNNFTFDAIANSYTFSSINNAGQSVTTTFTNLPEEIASFSWENVNYEDITIIDDGVTATEFGSFDAYGHAIPETRSEVTHDPVHNLTITKTTALDANGAPVGEPQVKVELDGSTAEQPLFGDQIGQIFG